jgi:2-dehydrotetronate isomerase
MVQLSANISMLFGEYPFLDRIARAADAGFAAVECHYPYEFPASVARGAAERAGVRFIGMNSPARRLGPDDLGLAALPGQEAAADARFEEALAYAIEAGAGNINVMAGAMAPDSAPGREALIGHLKHAGARAAEHGVTVMIEPLNRRDGHGYFVASTGQALDIIQAAGLPNVRLLFDVYHVQVTEGDILTRLKRLLPQIGHVQIAGVPDRHEPDTGELKIEAILRALDEMGYAGWVGAEYRPRGRTEEGLAWLQPWLAGQIKASGPRA